MYLTKFYIRLDAVSRVDAALYTEPVVRLYGTAAYCTAPSSIMHVPSEKNMQCLAQI